MGVKIHKCLKKYNRGISKVIPPAETLKIILKKIKKLEPEILDSYYEIKAKTSIPQYFVRGTDYYSQVVNDIGRANYSINTNGKGHFKTEALVSGLMEMAERYSCCKYLFKNPKNTVVSSFKKFNKHYCLDEFYSNPFYRKRVEILRSKDVESVKLLWYKTYSLDGQAAFLPLSLICYTYQYTNGMASGNTLEEALSHALCEVIERHCKTIVREKKLITPDINQASIRSSLIKKLLNNFKLLNQKVILKDLSLNMGIPVIGAVRAINRDKYFVTVGVAPNREEAIIRALVENSQIEPHVEPQIEHEEGQGKSSIKHHLKHNKTVNYSDLPNLPNLDIKKELLSLKSLLEKQNMRIFYVDTTDHKLNIPSVFVYTTNTKRHSSQIGYRNIIMGIIEESLRIKDYKQAIKFIKLGEKTDLKNIGLYLYYKGLVYAFKRNYLEAIKLFNKSLKKQLYEFQPIVNINIGICYFALGKFAKAAEYFIKNIKLYPSIKYSFIRSHHHFNSDLFKTTAKIYYDLREKLLSVEKVS